MKLYTEEQVRMAIMVLCELNSLKENVIMDSLTPIELPNYKEQLDRIEQLLIKKETSQRNRFTIGPL